VSSVQKNVVAVVVTHNRPEELRRVLAALEGQTWVPSHIVVLDNACTQSTQKVLQEFASVTVIRSDVNLGGAGGFAAGIKAALDYSPGWIWLMDDDAVPRLDSLEYLLDALSYKDIQEDKVGALCSTVYEFGRIAPMHRRGFNWSWAWERPISIENYSSDAVRIDIGSFVGFLLNANAVGVVGVPREEFFLAYDDTEYSLRLIKYGYDNWLIPASKIDHLRSSASRLRGTTFGPKHYFNIRNRIVVGMLYSHKKSVATLVACMVGLLIWARCGGLKRISSVQLLLNAVSDGIRGRLGGELG
jgi:rhamnopyranosyl-N-acetylglucosaminyl-diphospho-decaprenol beta-1,3/1,4-galactofuranosyltransferase